MKKNILTKTLALTAILAVQAGIAKADGTPSFGSDDKISHTTLWTFDQFQVGDIIDNEGKGINYAGLYLKGHTTSGDNAAVVSKSVQTITFGDYTYSTFNRVRFAGAHTFAINQMTSRSASSYMTDCLAFNANVAGTLYVYGAVAANDRTINVYLGNTGDITESTELSSCQLTTTGTPSTSGYVFTASIGKAGTVWLSSSSGACFIYAMKFVPSTESGDTKTFTMSDMGVMTFADTHAWMLPSGLKAYVNNRSGVKDGKLSLKEVTGTIPAGMGYILQGTHNTEYTLTLTDASHTNLNTEANPRYADVNYCFRPVVTDYALAASVTESSNTWNHYILVKDGESMVMNQSSGSGTLAAGKAYFSIRSDQITTTTTSEARGFTLDFGNGGSTTAIQSVTPSRDADNAPYYDLQGRRMAQPAKGIYIKNGKKVIVK